MDIGIMKFIPLVREPGVSISTDFGSKGHSNF